MKRAAPPLAFAFAALSGVASAQGAEDPIAELRACSLMERADRLECLDKLSRTVGRAQAAPKEDNWVISETTSPVDYTPIATAVATSRDTEGGPAMSLSIRCRGGRTELAVAGAALDRRGEDYVISYRINNGQPVQLAASVPAFGAGIAFRTDAVHLLQSLPTEGELALHLSPRVGPAEEGIFSLDGLNIVRAKMAATCKWPPALAKPND